MSIPPKIKILLGLIVVFVAGGVTGCWVHSKLAEHMFVRFLDNRTWAPAVLEGLERDLKLSSEQREQAKVLLEKSVEEVTNDFSRMGQELVRLHGRIQGILTPEQQEKDRKKFEAFRRELEQKYHITLPAGTRLEKTAGSRKDAALSGGSTNTN